MNDHPYSLKLNMNGLLRHVILTALLFLGLLPITVHAVNHNPDSGDEKRQSDIAFQNVPTEFQADSEGNVSVTWTISVSNPGEDGDGVSDGYQVVIELKNGEPVTIDSTSTSDSYDLDGNNCGCDFNLVLMGYSSESNSFVEVDRRDGIKVTSSESSGSGGSNGSVHYYYGLGSVNQGASGGRLLIESENPSALLYGPGGIFVTADPSIKLVNLSGAFSQALSDNYLTSIYLVSSDEYEIRSYLRSEVNNLGTSPDGPWTLSNDNNYFKRTIVENPGPQEIANTDDDTLYLTERVGDAFAYSFSQPNGEYLLKLHFAENFHDAAGKRLIDVTETESGSPDVERVLLNDYDIYDAAGARHAAVVETFPIAITDGSIDLNFITELYQAEVCAIEVVKPDETEITGTSDDELFYSERWGDFSYAITMANGDYDVELGFVERFYDAAAARTFDVQAEGSTVLNDYDIYDEAGDLDQAVVETIPVTVTGGVLNLNFTGVEGKARLAYIKVIADPSGTPSVVAAINVGGSSYTAADSTAFSADTNYTGGSADSAHGVQVAVNAGGPAYTAADTTIYSADTGFTGGKAFDSGDVGIRFTEESNGEVTEVYEFAWVTDPISGEFGECLLRSGWYDDSGSDAFLKSDGKLVEWSEDRTTYVETRTIRDEADQIVSKVEEHYEVFPFGAKIVEKIVDPDTAALATTWEYYEAPETPGPLPAGYAKVKRMDRYDGYWEEYDYTSNGRVSEIRSPYADGTYNRVETFTYSSSNPTVTRVVTVNSTEIGRSFKAEFNYTDEEEDWYVFATEDGVAWNASTNLITRSRRYLPSFEDPISHETTNAGRTKWMLNPDGTAALYSYSVDNGEFTTVTETGVPTISGGEVTAITDGIRVTQVTNADGEVISEEKRDISSDLILAEWYATEVDTLGRVTEKTYGDSTTETIQYFGDGAICGTCSGNNWLVESETDRNGVTSEYAYDALERRVEITRLGIKIRNTLDALGRTIQTERIGDDSSVIVMEEQVFDAAGRLVTKTNALDYDTVIAYSYPIGGGMIVTTTSPDGGTSVQQTYPDGKVQEISGTAVNPMKYSYGTWTDGEKVREIKVGASGAVTEWVEGYSDVAGRAVKMIYPDSAELTMVYNALGQLSKQVDPDGVTTLYAYDSRGRQIRKAIDMNDNDVIDLAGTDRITETVYAVGSAHSSVVNRVTVKTYATDSSSIATTVSVVERDGYGNRNWQIDTNGNESFTAINRISAGAWTITTTLPDGNQLLESYGTGRLSSRTQKDSTSATVTSVSYAYDPHGRLYTQTDARTGVTTYSYLDDDQVQTVTTSDPDGAGPLGYLLTEYEYDEMGRVTTTILPDTSESVKFYDHRGNVIMQYGSQTYPVEYVYDPQGRMTAMTTWQDFNETTGVGVSGAAETNWIYDSQRGWLNRKVDDDGNGVDYTYTDASRLASRTWERGVVTNYAYDRAGNLLAVDYSDSTPDVVYLYSRYGPKDIVTDGSFGSSPYNAGDILASVPSLSTIRYVYDYDYNAHLQVEAETVSNLLSGEVILMRQYEESGNAIGRMSGYELGTAADSDLYGEVAYTYDDAGRFLTVSNVSDTFTYAYLNNSNLLEAMTGPVHTVSYSYEPGRNAVSNIENEETVGTASVVSNYAYTMNALGQRIKREQNGTAYSLTTEDTFSYDYLGQVLGADNDTETSNAYNPTYLYDEIGNRKGNIVDTNGTTSYTSSLVNEYSAIGAVSPTYDDDGNLISDGIWTFTWDGENRLINATNGSHDIDYEYDYIGRLVTRNDGTNVEVYVYDEWNRIGKFVNGSFDTAYLWGLDLSGTMQDAGGVGGLLKEGNLYPLYDVNGNVMQKLNASGIAMMEVDYDPFGNVISGSLVGDYGFSTKPHDADSLFLYYGYRWYDTVTGRWTSRDPIAELGGLNLYAFLYNDHINYTDFLGAGFWESLAQGVVQAAVAVGTALAVSAAVAAFVGTAPITITGLVAVGAIALVTGLIQGSQTDGIGRAMGQGLVNGILQGALGGAGAAFTSSSTVVTAKYTVSQMLWANTITNVVVANISVAMSGSSGDVRMYVFASFTAAAFSTITFYNSDELINVLINLDTSIIVNVTCDAVGGDN